MVSRLSSNPHVLGMVVDYSHYGNATTNSPFMVIGPRFLLGHECLDECCLS
ncbi:hypothetical protein Lalb_Chr00c10g0404821 [Lupinus albus]|uniref:Uncharacterized protein n=1 Tax=Lupinus albus TaxID=3870 RepID=A0A6A4N5T4_LUPAL|nr:hypothetical protein Lalb_Chr00c10g0404821 [Lupinus albus]